VLIRLTGPDHDDCAGDQADRIRPDHDRVT